MALQDELKALADKFTIALAPPGGPGQPSVATINAPPDLTILSTAAGALKVTWLMKDVLFQTKDLEAALQKSPPDLPALNSAIKGGLPIPGVGGGAGQPSGVPGNVGQLVAELPMTVSTSIPVNVAVTWKVTDPAGAAVIHKTLEQSATRGVFVLPPAFVNDTGASPGATTYKITAEVKVTATAPAGAPALSAETRTLKVDVSVPSIPVPTLLVLFNHAQFDLSVHGGIPPCILVLVPPSLPYRDIGGVLGVLAPLAQALTALAPAFSNLSNVGNVAHEAQSLTRLVSLLNSVIDPSVGAKLIVRTGDFEPELHRIVFYQVFLYTHSAEDTFGSLYYVTLSGRTARFYNARNFNVSEGAFNLNIPANAFVSVIEHLAGDPPATDPAGAATSHFPASSGSFNDRLSSLQLIP